MHAVQDLIEQGKVVVSSSPSSSNYIFQSPLPRKCTGREQRICESHGGCPGTRRPSTPDFFSIRWGNGMESEGPLNSFSAFVSNTGDDDAVASCSNNIDKKKGYPLRGCLK